MKTLLGEWGRAGVEWWNEIGQYKPGRMISGQRKILTDQMVTWYISNTEGHPMWLKSPDRVGTGNDRVLSRSTLCKGSWEVKDLDFGYIWKLLKGFTHLAITSG